MMLSGSLGPGPARARDAGDMGAPGPRPALAARGSGPRNWPLRFLKGDPRRPTFNKVKFPLDLARAQQPPRLEPPGRSGRVSYSAEIRDHESRSARRVRAFCCCARLRVSDRTSRSPTALSLSIEQRNLPSTTASCPSPSGASSFRVWMAGDWATWSPRPVGLVHQPVAGIHGYSVGKPIASAVPPGQCQFGEVPQVYS
jgi:hypothetical protein